MPRIDVEKKVKEKQRVQTIEVPINLELINSKLNYIIALLEKQGG